MRILTLLFILHTFLFGYNYNDMLLKAQASIFPKIMMLDKKLEEKLIDGKIVYTIVFDEEDHDTALRISEFINKNYKNNFDKYSYKINLVKFTDLSIDTNASIIYMLNSNKDIKKVADIAKQKGIITFAYDINNLKNGLLFSLMLEKSTVLYLNKENLHTQKVDFVDSLLQMVKFIDKGNS